MSRSRQLFLLAGLVFIVFFLAVPSFVAEQNDNRPLNIQEKLKQALLSNNVAELQPFLSEGKRVFSNWEDVFGSTGYFGLSQFKLSFNDFYKKFKITSCYAPQPDPNENDTDKILLELNIKYQDIVTFRTQPKTIYILLLKQQEAVKPLNLKGWVIIEIKTIQ